MEQKENKLAEYVNKKNLKKKIIALEMLSYLFNDYLSIFVIRRSVKDLSFGTRIFKGVEKIKKTVLKKYSFNFILYEIINYSTHKRKRNTSNTNSNTKKNILIYIKY